MTYDKKLPVTRGGTGGDTAATARTGLGAAASGANTDITSLDGANILSQSPEIIITSATITGTKGFIYVGGAGTVATLPAYSLTRKSIICVYNSNSTASGNITLARSSSDIILQENGIGSTSINIPPGQIYTLNCVEGTPFGTPGIAYWVVTARSLYNIHRAVSTTTHSPTLNNGVDEYTNASGCTVSLPTVVGQTAYFKGFKNSSTGTVTINAFSGEFILDAAGTSSTTYSLPPNSAVFFSSTTNGVDGFKVIAESIAILPVLRGGTGSTTASGARTNLSAAASGANSDITSLTGLTSPLTSGQGLPLGVSADPYRRTGSWSIDGPAGSYAYAGIGSQFGIIANSSSSVITATYGTRQINTSTLSGNQAYIYSSNTPLTRYESQGMFSSVLIPTTVTDVRLIMGLHSVVSYIDDPSTRHCAVFRYSTSASDTTWKCYTSDGSASTITDSGITVSASTVYRMTIDMRDPAAIKFYINGSLVATNTTTLPTASTNLVATGGAVVTLTTSVATLDVGNIFIDTR